MRLEGTSCLITGAASGIGRATAFAAAAKGARLVLTDLDAEGLEQTIRAAGGSVLHAGPADLTDRAAVADLAAEVHARHGTLDVVMNIAGVSTWGPVEALRGEDWDRVIDVNLRGPIRVIEAFVGPMVAAGRGGHLVNVSSAAGLLGLPWHAAYSASKFGLRGVSEVLRFDLRRHGIGVTLVCPGAVDTPLVETVQIIGVDREHPEMRRMIERFRRHAVTPEHVAAAILSGIERNRYLVFTSADIRLAHALQRAFPPAYELVMRVLNDGLVRTAKRSSA
jgi:NAD(P)-dependent dehydrogenase (short-subunit alcohol dehydrogenase family)